MEAIVPAHGGAQPTGAPGAPPRGGPAPLAGEGFSLFPPLAGAFGATAAPATVGSGPGEGLGAAGQSLYGPVAGASATAAATAPASLAPLIDQVAQAHGLPPSLLTALVQEESGYNPGARSPAGAMGLTQLMPATAASLGVQNPWDPVENLNGGAAYLAGLLSTYGGNVALALAAYNAGPGAVRQWGGIPPYPETKAYVRNVMAMAGLGAAQDAGTGG
jgi:soluble lytic murein transglycosylase-like protein